jgi:hypothetical protein
VRRRQASPDFRDCGAFFVLVVVLDSLVSVISESARVIPNAVRDLKRAVKAK